MLDHYVNQGRVDALRSFGLTKAAEVAAAATPPVPAPGFMDRAKAFGGGQLDAAKDLFRNLRGGFGGQANPGVITGAVPEASAGMARATQRGAALGNLKTLAPTLAAGGALYMLHRHNQAKREQQARQQAMMGGGYSPM